MAKNIENNKFGIGTILLVFVVVFGISYYYTSVRIPVKDELSQLQKIASDYKNKNGNFGIITGSNKGDLKNCFAGNTFIKTSEATEVLTGKDVENISCVFKTATNSPVVDAWSVTIVKGEKAYCEDSTGVRRETPGLTTLAICNAE